jgi:DNA repair protein RecO (recombination protein O)
MPNVKSEGIILRTVNWKEQSRIVTIFTDNFGKISIVDKGGRSFKSKRGRLVDFSRLEISYFMSEKSELGYLNEVDVREVFTFEKEGTLGRLTFASAAIEILNDLLPENEAQTGLYHLTMRFLRLMDAAAKQSLVAVFLAYFIRALSYLGYGPNFSGCVGCAGEALSYSNSDGQNYVTISPERGGIVCGACQTPGEYYIKLLSARLDILSQLQTASLAEAAAVVVPLAVGEELLEVLTAFMKYQTGAKDLRSLEFLEKLKNTKF